MSRFPLASRPLREPLSPSASWTASFPTFPDCLANPTRPGALSMDMTSSRKPFLALPRGSDSSTLSPLRCTFWTTFPGQSHKQGPHQSIQHNTRYKYHLENRWMEAGVTGTIPTYTPAHARLCTKHTTWCYSYAETLALQMSKTKI